VLEQIQTDIWVRFQRMRGNQATYVCADDTHGTATMIKAEQEGISAEALVENMRQLHLADSEGFLIAHDNYYSTHSPENQHYSELIYNRLKEADLIFTEKVEQLYDPEKAYFWRTVLLWAPAHGVRPQISTVITARPAGPPTTPTN
jgi:methionyl-tRNA synthetase